MTGAVAAIAEPPQIEEPTPIKIEDLAGILINLKIMACHELVQQMCDAVFQFTDYEPFFAADLAPDIIVDMRAQIRRTKPA